MSWSPNDMMPFRGPNRNFCNFVYRYRCIQCPSKNQQFLISMLSIIWKVFLVEPCNLMIEPHHHHCIQYSNPFDKNYILFQPVAPEEL